MLVQDDRGDRSSFFWMRGLFSLNGIRFAGFRDSCIPKETSRAVSADNTMEEPYVIDSPYSDSFPATIAPTKKAHAERAK